MFIFLLSLVAAGGTFAYDKYLQSSLEAKAEELAVAQREVNQDQVEDFVRLRDRLTYGQGLLDNHIALGQVFDVLEEQTLTNVRFSSLDLTVADDRTAQIDISGTARNFNALAAQSNAFAAEKGIRRAIFSGIVVNEDNTVSFTLTADLDGKLLIDDGSRAQASQPAAGPAVAPAPTQTAPAPAETAPAATTSPASAAPTL